MADAVLDSSALLAIFRREPGTDQVLPYLEGAMVSTVNWAEVAGKLVDGGFPADIARAAIDQLPLDIQPFSRDDAYTAAELRSIQSASRLSLGDRACLALGRRTGRTVITADRAWRDLDLDVEVVLIR